MVFDHSKLLGKMKEKGCTQEALSRAIGINKATLNAKLKNKNSFTTREIDSICNVLNISKDEIKCYFFAN